MALVAMVSGVLTLPCILNVIVPEGITREFGLLGVFGPPLVSLYLSALAITHIRHSPGRLRGMPLAVTGLAFSGMSCLLMVIALVVVGGFSLH